jgi:hypothetical protein
MGRGQRLAQADGQPYGMADLHAPPLELQTCQGLFLGAGTYHVQVPIHHAYLLIGQQAWNGQVGHCSLSFFEATQGFCSTPPPRSQCEQDYLLALLDIISFVLSSKILGGSF